MLNEKNIKIAVAAVSAIVGAVGGFFLVKRYRNGKQTKASPAGAAVTA